MKTASLLVHVFSAFALTAAAPSLVLERSILGVPAGAAYFMTNEPTGNLIIVAELGSDGHMTYRSAVSTRGLSTHVTGGNRPDPLMSQGAIQASSAGNILAVVNAGSSTVSLFSINPQDPADIHQIGEPVSSGGEFPTAVAINNNGTQVCVFNGGQLNGINCYTVDRSFGLVRQPSTLRFLNLNQTSGPVASAGHQIAFNEANDKLIVTIVGTPGYLAIWDVLPDGTLSQNFATVTPPSGGMNPFSLTVLQGKNGAMLTADTNLGFAIYDLAGFSVGSGGNQSAPARSSAVAIPGQMANCWSTYSTKTGNYYVIDAGTSVVTEVNVDNNLKGSVVKSYSQLSGSQLIDSQVAMLGGRDFLYLLAPNTTLVNVISLDGPGNARSVGSYSFATTVKLMGISVDTSNVQGMATFVKA